MQLAPGSASSRFYWLLCAAGGLSLDSLGYWSDWDSWASCGSEPFGPISETFVNGGPVHLVVGPRAGSSTFSWGGSVGD